MAMIDGERHWRRPLKDDSRVDAYVAIGANYVRFIGDQEVCEDLFDALASITGATLPPPDGIAARAREIPGQTTIDELL